MEQQEINFDSFEIKGNNVLIEYTTLTSSGIVIQNENKTLQSGWFKVVKAGNVTDPLIKAGAEVFAFMHHQPYEFHGIVFQTPKEQEKQLLRREARKSIVIADGLGGLKEPEEVEREFALIREHDILFIRTQSDE